MSAVCDSSKDKQQKSDHIWEHAVLQSLKAHCMCMRSFPVHALYHGCEFQVKAHSGPDLQRSKIMSTNLHVQWYNDTLCAQIVIVLWANV